jgi:hypothetical protein
MDINKMLEELRAEREQVEQAILYWSVSLVVKGNVVVVLRSG